MASNGIDHSLEGDEEGGHIKGTVNMHMPDGNVLKSPIEKVILFDDGSVELSYANGRPPRSGIIAYHITPIDDTTLQVSQHFKIYPPPDQNFGGAPPFTLKRVRTNQEKD